MEKKELLLLLLIIPIVGYSQIRTPKFSNEFLSIGVGARGLAMSGAQSANVADITAGYWNPAGLLGIGSTYEISLMHSEYFAGIAKYDYGAFATRIDSFSVLSISLIRFGIDDIPDTRFLYDASGNINYDNIEFFAAADYAFMFSYARSINALPGLGLGANFKVIHRKAGDFANAWGFGLDFGAQYTVKTWSFGLMLRDITGTFTTWFHNPELVIDIYTQTGNEIPENSVELTLPKAIFGFSKLFIIKSDFDFLAALDLETTFDGERNVLLKSKTVSVDPKIGLEIGYKKIVYLRGGIGEFQKVKDFDGSETTTFRPNFGLGVKIKAITIDYALTDVGNQAESLFSHVFSIKASFDDKK